MQTPIGARRRTQRGGAMCRWWGPLLSASMFCSIPFSVRARDIFLHASFRSPVPDVGDRSRERRRPTTLQRDHACGSAYSEDILPSVVLGSRTSARPGFWHRKQETIRQRNQTISGLTMPVHLCAVDSKADQEDGTRTARPPFVFLVLMTHPNSYILWGVLSGGSVDVFVPPFPLNYPPNSSVQKEVIPPRVFMVQNIYDEHCGRFISEQAAFVLRSCLDQNQSVTALAQTQQLNVRQIFTFRRTTASIDTFQNEPHHKQTPPESSSKVRPK